MEDQCLGVTKKVRKAIGKAPGDTVRVVNEKDDEERTVEVPSALQEWLNEHEEERKFFDGLSYNHRNEYLRWITGARKEETRKRRIEKTFRTVKGRIKHP